MGSLLFPFRLLLDVASPVSVLAPVALVVLAIAVVILAVSILIRTCISRLKKRGGAADKRDTPPEDSRGK